MPINFDHDESAGHIRNRGHILSRMPVTSREHNIWCEIVEYTGGFYYALLTQFVDDKCENPLNVRIWSESLTMQDMNRMVNEIRAVIGY